MFKKLWSFLAKKNVNEVACKYDSTKSCNGCQAEKCWG